jgi:hypothetical protein
MMKRPLPCTPSEWLVEIQLAVEDAREAKPFGKLIDQPITDADLFHLAPSVCLKFRGRKLTGREADRVTKVALANFVVNSDPEGVDHGLKAKPMLAFALCYVTAHLALDLVDEQAAEAILHHCEDHLIEG